MILSFTDVIVRKKILLNQNHENNNLTRKLRGHKSNVFLFSQIYMAVKKDLIMFTIWPYWLYPRFWTSGTGAMNFTTLIEERNRHTLSHTKLWYGVDEVQKRVLNFWIISFKQNCVWTNLRLGKNNCNCRSAKIIQDENILLYSILI